MNKSVKSIFSSSSKSKSKSRSKRRNQENGSGNNNLEVNGAGSELEKLSDASGLSGSAAGSSRSKKLFNRDLSGNLNNDNDIDNFLKN
jgi:hypothetical protein